MNKYILGLITLFLTPAMSFATSNFSANSNQNSTPTPKLETRITTSNPAVTRPSEQLVLVGANALGASTGRIDIRAEVVKYKNLAPMIGVSSYAEQKIRPLVSSTTETPVDHSYLQLGATYYVRGTQAPANILINPYWSFGTERDQAEVKKQTGIGARILGQVRMAPEYLLEAGVQIDAVTGSTAGRAYLGVGAIF